MPNVIKDAWNRIKKPDSNSIDAATNIVEVAEYVNFVCDMVASLQVKLYKTTDHGVTEVKGDPRSMALNVGTDNATMDGYQLKKAMVRDYLLCGEGYAYISEVEGIFSGLYYVPAYLITSRVNKYQHMLDNRSYTLLFNSKYELDARKFLKFVRHSINGVEGYGILSEQGGLINVMCKELKGLEDAMGTPGIRSGFAKSETRIPTGHEEEQREDIEKALSQAQMGDIPIVSRNVDMVWLDDPDMYKTLAERGVELHTRLRKMFKLDSSFEDRITENVIPVIKAFESMLNFSLLSYDDRKNYFFEFDTDALFKVNPRARYEMHKLAIDSGLKTRNEIRNSEKMEKKDGLDSITLSLKDIVCDNNKIIVPNTGVVIDINTGEVKNDERNKNSIPGREE
jgi:hypothetical protein